MEPVIETKGLKHVYIDSDNNPVTALDGIDLQRQRKKYAGPTF